MMAQIDKLILTGVIGSWSALVILVFTIIKYFPSQKFCDVQRKNNDNEHNQIRNWIEKSEDRSDKRHDELKAEFKDVKELIKNGGNPPPRIRT